MFSFRLAIRQEEFQIVQVIGDGVTTTQSGGGLDGVRTL
jgi:hypothetical protein